MRHYQSFLVLITHTSQLISIAQMRSILSGIDDITLCSKFELTLKKCSEGFEGTKICVWKFHIDSQNVFEMLRRPVEKTQCLQKFT